MTVTDDSSIGFDSLSIQAVLTSHVKPVGLWRFPGGYFYWHPQWLGGITENHSECTKILNQSPPVRMSCGVPVNLKVARDDDISKIRKGS